jgi:hypothetical protein
MDIISYEMPIVINSNGQQVPIYMKKPNQKHHLSMNLAKHDEQILHIEEVIEAKRRMLLEKQKKLKFISNQNQFLDVVKDDYNKYYNYISKQKQDQIKALEVLNSYIRDLTTSGKLTKHNIDDANFEQERILREIKSIRKGLDSIISDTNYMEN